jgi:hypothetical protein
MLVSFLFEISGCMTVNADLEREKGHGHERNPPLFFVVSQAGLEAATHLRTKAEPIP